MNNSYVLNFFFKIYITITYPPTYPGYQRFFSRVRQGASPAAAQHVFARAGHFFRLNRNRKPRIKSLWHPEYHHHDQTEYCQISIRFRLLYCKTIGYQIRNEGRSRYSNRLLMKVTVKSHIIKIQTKTR